jgi:hypothetical protein
MLDKDLTEPLAQLADGWQCAQHLTRDEVKATTPGGKGNCLLFDAHISRFSCKNTSLVNRMATIAVFSFGAHKCITLYCCKWCYK